MGKIFLLFLLLLTDIASASNKPAYLIYDVNKETIVKGQGMDEKRPIASLTKLMTALIIVESNLSMNELVSYNGGIWPWRKVKRSELLESLLIRSDNSAAEALAKSWPGGRTAFLADMNRRAHSLQMRETRFFDPSGLDKRNISTATDLSRLIIETSKHESIRKASTSIFLTIESVHKKRATEKKIPNTNKGLLFEFDSIVVSKTGWTIPAGRCLALMVEKEKHPFVIVILGEKTNDSREERARHLINNYVIINENGIVTNENRIYMFNF